jgi:hypothetical protein
MKLDVPLVEKLRRAIFAVIVLELFGLVAAALFASALSNQLTLPFGIVFAVDYIFIVLSAVLAELAAPSENAAQITTSFVIATSTLAPLAVFVTKALGEDPQEHNTILKHFVPNWYPIIIVTAVAVCTVVAILAALALGRIANKNSEASKTVNNSPGLFERTLLSASILLFGSYTFLVNDWKPPKFESNVDMIGLVLPTVGVVGLIVIFCSVPWIVGPSVRSYSEAYRKGAVDVLPLLKRGFPSTGPVIIALAVIAALGGLLLRNHWVPVGLLQGVRGLLGKSLYVSAHDLARLLFLFALIIVVFLLVAILVLAASAVLNSRRPPPAPPPQRPQASKQSEPSTGRVAPSRLRPPSPPPTPQPPQQPQISAQILDWLADPHNILQMLLWLFYTWAFVRLLMRAVLT